MSTPTGIPTWTTTATGALVAASGHNALVGTRVDHESTVNRARVVVACTKAAAGQYEGRAWPGGIAPPPMQRLRGGEHGAGP